MMQSPSAVATADVLAQAILAQRPSRMPDHAAENRALVMLADTLSAQPRVLLQVLVDTVMILCRAESVGVSILHPEEGVFRWDAIAGAFAPNIDGSIARELSPCASVIDADEMLLLAQPAHRFPALAAIDPPIAEVLLVPFHARGKAVGTLWVVMHTDGRHFDLEDARVLRNLTRFAAAGYQLAHVTESEDALRANEARYRAIVSQSHVGIAQTDLEGRFQYVNERFGTLAGRAPVALLAGVRLQDLVQPQEQARAADRMARMLATGEPFVREHQYVRPDGSTPWVTESVTPIVGGDGVATGATVVAWDVTERRRTEQRVRDSESRYHALLHNIDQGFCVLQVLFARDGSAQDYRWLEINPSFERQTGLVGALGKTARELVPDLDDSWFKIYGDVARTGEPKRFVNYAPAMQRWFDVFAFRVGHAAECTVALLFTDITATKQAEDALRESEARFRRMADTAPAMLWLTDQTNATTFLSHGWTEYTGVAWIENDPSRDPDAWVRALHPDDQARALDQFVLAAAERRPFSIDYRLRRADGAYRWCLDSGRPRFSDEGAWLGYIGSVIDVHERKQAEDALRIADRRKDEFIATLAHELRNPLAPLRNSLELIRVRDGAATANDPVHAMMTRQVSHLTRLVDDLLEVSRITRGRIELRRQKVDLATIVRSAVEASRPALDAAQHTFSVSLPPQAIILEVDDVRIAQVLGNLLNNAARYTDAGGRITLEARAEEGHAVVRVSDTGIGLAPEQRTTIFDLFSQVDRSAARARGGLGIGLSLVRSLVTMHGGSVEAHSAGLGHGSEFIVRLPLPVSSAQETSAHDASPAPLEHHRLRVLIVDDNRDSADSLAALLQMLGAQTHVAYDGPGAIAAFDHKTPTVVLLDLGMPRMDGYEVAQRLRAHPRGAGITLIALTGWGQEEDRRRTHAAGFDHHLLKPVNIEALQGLLVPH